MGLLKCSFLHTEHFWRHVHMYPQSLNAISGNVHMVAKIKHAVNRINSKRPEIVKKLK